MHLALGARRPSSGARNALSLEFSVDRFQGFPEINAMLIDNYQHVGAICWHLDASEHTNGGIEYRKGVKQRKQLRFNQVCK